MKLIKVTAKKGETTAKADYNAPGWMRYHTHPPWGFSAMSNSSAGAGSTCGAWLAQHIWLHYDFTRDTEFLRGDASTGWSMAWKANFWARRQTMIRRSPALMWAFPRSASNPRG